MKGDGGEWRRLEGGLRKDGIGRNLTRKGDNSEV